MYISHWLALHNEDANIIWFLHYPPPDRPGYLGFWPILWFRLLVADCPLIPLDFALDSRRPVRAHSGCI